MTYGACLRAKNFKVAFCGIGDGDATTQKKWDAELQAFRDADRQGINPAGTKMHQIREAVELSNAAGRPYDAATGGFA